MISIGRLTEGAIHTIDRNDATLLNYATYTYLLAKHSIVEMENILRHALDVDSNRKPKITTSSVSLHPELLGGSNSSPLCVSKWKVYKPTEIFWRRFSTVSTTLLPVATFKIMDHSVKRTKLKLRSDGLECSEATGQNHGNRRTKNLSQHQTKKQEKTRTYESSK
jgi:hypothetical protein